MNDPKSVRGDTVEELPDLPPSWNVESQVCQVLF